MSLLIFLIIASKIKHLGSYNARFARHNNLPAIIGQVKNYNIQKMDKYPFYKEKFTNLYIAESMGIIEEIIAPHDTRERIAALPDALKDKKEVRLPKSHNNIALQEYLLGLLLHVNARRLKIVSSL